MLVSISRKSPSGVGVGVRRVTHQVLVSMSCHMKTLVLGLSLAAVQWARPVSLELSGPSSSSASSESEGKEWLNSLDKTNLYLIRLDDIELSV